MKVFLCWSGERSRQVAQALNDWLPTVIQAVEPWMSGDIGKGVRWGPEVSAELEESRVGIICLASDNLGNPWILFEAGAVSKTKDASVCTFLLDLKTTDIEQPLSQFQATIFDKDDVGKLIETIRQKAEARQEKAPKKAVDESFEQFWPALKHKLDAARELPTEKVRPPRRQDDVLEDILSTVRRLERQQAAQSSVTQPWEVDFRKNLKGAKGKKPTLGDDLIPKPEWNARSQEER